ncbi:MAG TPA: hypothetical protein VFI47_09725 [Acidimicrobiales bacterium]|nr:hypothetical protein [Acidimicrobiales bacterium]
MHDTGWEDGRERAGGGVLGEQAVDVGIDAAAVGEPGAAGADEPDQLIDLTGAAIGPDGIDTGDIAGVEGVEGVEEGDLVVDLTEGPPDVPPHDDDVVVRVGSIGAGMRWLHLPDGSVPLRGTAWRISDQVHTTTQIPSYAIVLAVIFSVFFLLGLLFLLIKETTVEGVVQVGVEGDGFSYATQVPVASYAEVREVHHRVKAIRHLAAAA